ncbi:MAG TPA: Xaa-Pro aminopeptidase [Gemmatimonadaceae bacterium]|nr:Xaa-Pro aminopeptidase [Gemmatimonadaceae bacterium]
MKVLAAALLLVFPAAARGQSIIESLQPEYAERRAQFISGVDDGVILVLGAREPEKDYLQFFQAPSLYYLTGFREPNGALVMVKAGDAVRATMYVSPRDPAREAWTGARLGTAGVSRVTGMASREADELIPDLDTLLRGGRPLMIVTDPGEAPRPAWLPPVEALFVDTLRARLPGLRVVDLTPRLQRQRAVKSPSELALIRHAAALTVRAHREAMQAVEPGVNEFELQALIEYTFRRNGADRPGFASIVGSGANATTLHYNTNDGYLQPGDLVVMDIGALYKGYSADVTRTVPVSGTFSAPQRAIYTIVRDAQAAAERQVRIGGSAQQMQDSSDATLAAGLAELGLIDAPDATYDCGRGRRCHQAMLFTMHGLSHGIGLEVHDPEAWYFGGTFANGSAFTIEPGLYVRRNLLDDVIPRTPANEPYRRRLAKLLPRYANIGVRIEDDYVVTDAGVEWISRAPREIDEIESLMRGGYAGPAGRESPLVELYRRDVP